ncbi:glycosyltransferase [Maritalea porphyrae]|uniref:Mannosyltransferase n=1 Tax=Maritalea porphyrae TaxID=880732 RepID=A0ABQ5UU05_9HYPH|nr:glycosyltransferase [Maritalea porphyrae]GLQ18658.1 mannosyltransferase [Maritalea porphyrae]
MPKNVIYHDYFDIRGGGEKLVLTLAESLQDCALTTGYITEQSYALDRFPAATKSLDIPLALRRKGTRLLSLCSAFGKEAALSTRHNVRIFSGVAAPMAATKTQLGINLYYCHTPPRFVFDQKEFYHANLSPLNQVIAPPILSWYKTRYEKAVSNMDVVVANSENIKRRVKEFLNIDAVVVYPPVETTSFNWQPAKGYYLSNARLTPLKRVTEIVKAFRKLPDVQLIVASGGEELDKIKAMSATAPNIKVLGWVTDNEMKKLVSEAIATVYLAREEDFGMSPVESMAAGKPVIGVAEGGLVETVVPGKTGILLPSTFKTMDVINAVQQLSPAVAKTMRKDCESRADLFSVDSFEKNMRRLIEETLREKKTKRAATQEFG